MNTICNRYLFVMTKEGKDEEMKSQDFLEPVTSFLHSLTTSGTWEMQSKKWEWKWQNRQKIFRNWYFILVINTVTWTYRTSCLRNGRILAFSRFLFFYFSCTTLWPLMLCRYHHSCSWFPYRDPITLSYSFIYIIYFRFWPTHSFPHYIK